jgi:hypothetical protein
MLLPPHLTIAAFYFLPCDIFGMFCSTATCALYRLLLATLEVPTFSKRESAVGALIVNRIHISLFVFTDALLQLHGPGHKRHHARESQGASARV